MIQQADRRSTAARGRIAAAAFALFLAACAPRVDPAGPRVAEPRLEGDRIVAADGAALPLRRWLPTGRPRAAILALHGFNDYSNAFSGPAERLARRGIATYAYDQRGFGAAPGRGFWAGAATLVEDARTAAALVRRAHPGIPVHMLGSSMGGAVALLATTHDGETVVDGAILAGPAVRGRRHIGAAARAALWILARTAPWLRLSGEGVPVTPSDNTAMLRALGRDPLVIKRTRVDALHGLLDLMDAALEAGGRLKLPTLVLVGARDELVTGGAMDDLLDRLPRGGPVRTATYPAGHHMLLRDLGAARVVEDIAAWIADRAAPLPSGADRAARENARKPGRQGDRILGIMRWGCEVCRLGSC